MEIEGARQRFEDDNDRGGKICANIPATLGCACATKKSLRWSSLRRRSLPLRRGLQEEVVGPLRPHSVGFDAEGEAKVGDRVQGLQNRYHVWVRRWRPIDTATVPFQNLKWRWLTPLELASFSSSAGVAVSNQRVLVDHVPVGD